MAFKIVAFLACSLAIASAGDYLGDYHGNYHGDYHGDHLGSQYAYAAPAAVKTVAAYSSAPAVSYSHISRPITHSKAVIAAPLAAHSYHHEPILAHKSLAIPVHQDLSYGYGHSAGSLGLSHGYSGAGHYQAPISHIHNYHSDITAVPVAKTVAYTAPAIAKTVHAVPSHTLAYAPSHIAYDSPAIGSSHQTILRTHDNTISHYGKAVDTPYSSVRKYDTRINAEPHHYNVAAVQYSAAPVIAQKTYAAAAPVYAQHGHSAISYSPATHVSHASFEGLGAHYQW